MISANRKFSVKKPTIDRMNHPSENNICINAFLRFQLRRSETHFVVVL